MTFSDHPQDDLLQAYRRDPDAERFSAISLHLAQCSECRRQIEMMETLQAVYPRIDNEVPSEAQQQRIDELANDALSDTQRQQLKQEIRENPVMLKSALYSLANEVQIEAPADSAFHAETLEPQGLWSRVKQWLDVPTPVFGGAVAASLIALTVGTLQLNTASLDQDLADQPNIVAYQDSSSMRFIPPQSVPGIGFFSGANNYAKPYGNIELEFNADNRLQMLWPDVEGATEYQISLYRFNEGDKQLVHKATTAEPRTMVDLQLESYNQRFEWTLSGTTTEQETFITSGGFVIGR
jgi:hypothetical protein